MAVYWTFAPAPLALWNTADVPLAQIPAPRTQLTEVEWKDALALQASGYELVNGVGDKPAGQMPAPSLAQIRAGLQVRRLWFHDACRAMAYGGGTVWSALQARLPAVTQTARDRYVDIATFRRTAAETATYFQDAGGVNLTDVELDTLFQSAMALQTAGEA